MVRLWTFTSLFLFIRARTLDAQMAPLFSHSAQGTQHVTGFRGTVNSEYFSSQLGLGKKKLFGPVTELPMFSNCQPV